MREAEQHCQRVFDRVPVAILELDLTGVASSLHELEVRDSETLKRYLRQNPAAVGELAAKIVITDVNESAVALYKAGSKDALLGSIDRLIAPAPVLEQTLLALAGEERRFEAEAVARDHGGEGVRVAASVSLPGAADERGILCLTDLSRYRPEPPAAGQDGALAACRQALARSQQELEQFLYATSHDLNEPLRTVVSFTQLLARRYGGQLDERADRYINHAVAAATRMRVLLSGLLELSRVGTRGEPPRPASCREALEDALASMRGAIRDSGAHITHGELPVVMADPAQLTQALGHLIANGIRFRGPEPPRIHVSAARAGREWILSVADNGIGIEESFFDEVFKVFRQLHPRDQYPGPGVGLAVVKKIVERHGGRAWVESQVGVGTTFYVTFSAPDTGREPRQ